MSRLRLSLTTLRRVRFARSRFGGSAAEIARRTGLPADVVRAAVRAMADGSRSGGRLSGYSPRMIRTVVAAYRRGVSVTDVLAQHRISRSTLYRMLDALEVPRRGSASGARAPRRRHKRYPAAYRALVVAAYRQDTPLRAIERRYDVSRDTVLRWVEAAGCPLRSGRRSVGGPLSAEETAGILRAYETASAAAVCARFERLGLTLPRLRTLLQARGIPFRGGRRQEDPPALVRAVAAAAATDLTELALKQRFRIGAARLKRLLAASGIALRWHLRSR